MFRFSCIKNPILGNPFYYKSPRRRPFYFVQEEWNDIK